MVVRLRGNSLRVRGAHFKEREKALDLQLRALELEKKKQDKLISRYKAMQQDMLKEE